MGKNKVQIKKKKGENNTMTTTGKTKIKKKNEYDNTKN